jgi:hypothetical protein
MLKQVVHMATLGSKELITVEQLRENHEQYT